MHETQNVTIETIVNAPIEKVWDCWITPDDITKWNNASDDWYTPHATNDFVEGGSFVYRMEAKDGSFGFDFGGKYDAIKKHEQILYTLGDGRKVEVAMSSDGDKTVVKEIFEAENTNPVEMQQQGWQNILDNFKKYVEGK